MLSKIVYFVKNHKKEITLFAIVFLLSLLSFAVGYLASKL